MLGSFAQGLEAIMLSALNVFHCITLWAPLSLELTADIMLGKVLPQCLPFAAVILANHLDKATHLPVLIDILVSDLLLAAQARVLTLDGQLPERLQKHGMGIDALKRFVSAVRAGNTFFIPAEISVLNGAVPTETLATLAALQWLNNDMLTDATVNHTLVISLDFFNKLIFLDCGLPSQSSKRLVLTRERGVICHDELHLVGTRLVRDLLDD